MISHQEAEVLISARQDAPLDPMVERELQAHLATCDSCRAFAVATEKLTAGMRQLPHIAANPRVKREVMGRVRAGRNPLAGILGGFGSGFQPGPAIAAIALVAIIGIFGWFALDRVFFDDGGNNNQQLAAVPTQQVTEAPTATSIPETAVPTEPAPTAQPTAPVPTAEPTTEPTQPAPTAEPTALPTEPAPTAEPTDEPAPTEPAPSAEPTQPAPTAEPTAVPTETVEPTVESTEVVAPTAEPTELAPTDAPQVQEAGDGPTDLTTMSQLESTPEPPAEIEAQLVATPTEMPATPTEAVIPTELPATPTEIPATAEPTATEVPTEEPTPTAPPIEPIDGSTSEPVEQPTSEPVADDGTGGTEVPTEADGSVIEPIGGETEESATSEPTSGDPTVEAAGIGSGEDAIVPIEPDGEPASDDTTPEAGEIDSQATAQPTQETLDESNSVAIQDVSEPYTNIAGDPAGKLGLTPEGRMEFMAVPDGASMTTGEGYRMQMAESQPGVVQLCGDGFCEPGTEAPADADGWLGDVPMGYVDGTAYWLRMYDSKAEIYAASPAGTQLAEPSLVLEIGPTQAPDAVYESGGSLYAWLPSGEWVVMSGGSAQVLSGSYGEPTNVRFAPSPVQGPLIGYFSGGSLVVAPVSSPDSAVLTLPTDGVDFDIAPPGDRVAMIQGNNIVIYDLDGAVTTVYAGGDAQPGSVIWLNSGLVWVDRATGGLYQIPETGN